MLLGHFSFLPVHGAGGVAIHPGKTAGHTTFIFSLCKNCGIARSKDMNPELLAAMPCVVESTCSIDNTIQLPFKLLQFGILLNILFIEIHYEKY